jgi:hypothetical protein
MGQQRHEAEDRSIALKVLREGTNLDRRSLFVSAAAFGTLAAAPALAQTTPAPSAPAAAPAAPAAPARRIIVKDDSRVLNIGATVRSGNYIEFHHVYHAC